MYKLDIKKAEKPESKLQISTGSQMKQENSRKTSTSASLTTLKPLTVWITTDCGKSRLPYLPPEKSVCRSRSDRIRHGTMDWFQVGKGVHQGCILSPCLFNFYAEYIIWSSKLDEAQAGIKIARRNLNNLIYADDTILMAESKEELKSLLMKVNKSRVKRLT